MGSVISESSGAVTRQVVYMTVTNGNHNIRKGPGTQYEILSVASNGKQLEVYEDIIDNWFELTEGGFISKQAFSNSGSSTPNYKLVDIREDAWLHTGPSIDTPKITMLSSGTSYPLLGIHGSWYQIKIGGAVGYVPKSVTL
jgi:uncharacterized protein YgiM (DUF1202 family)